MPNKSGHVLQIHESRSNLPNPAPDVGPYPSLVVLSSSLAGHAERLARHSAHDDIHASSPSGSVERGDIAPNGRGVDLAVCHTRRQYRGCRNVPLTVSNDAQSRQNESDAQFETSDAGADGNGGDGT